MIALVDCNNFYASCERVFNPKLKGRPIIVLSNNDGCTIARSDEAKAVGIEMGAPAHLIKDVIKKNDVAVFSSNYTLYGDMSDRVMSTLKEFAPRIEVYSIDEAFLDLSGIKQDDLARFATMVRSYVTQATGIPVSIGVAPSKTLAKMANRFAKKTKKQVGVHVVSTHEQIEEILRYTKVGDVWGIGKQNGEKLTKLGVKTAHDLLQLSDDWMRSNMTVVGQRLLNELKGIPCIPFEEKPPAKKNICTAKSFGQLLTDLNDIKEATATYAYRVAEKLRKQKSCAGAVHVFLRTNPYIKEHKQYYNSVTVPLQVATNNPQEIILHAFYALNLLYKPGYNYLKSGVEARDIVPESEVQQGLFDDRIRTKDRFVIEAMDGINRSWGRDLIKYACMGNGEKWKMKQEKLSPCYTTRFDQIPKVKI